MGAFIGSDPVSIMSNYFVSLFIIIGFPGGVIFLALIAKAISNYIKFSNLNRVNEASKIFISTALSILSMIIVIFIFFPYVKYFPLMMIMGYLIGFSEILDEKIEFRYEK